MAQLELMEDLETQRSDQPGQARQAEDLHQIQGGDGLIRRV